MAKAKAKDVEVTERPADDGKPKRLSALMSKKPIFQVAHFCGIMAQTPLDPHAT